MSTYYHSHLLSGLVDIAPCPHIISHLDMDMTPCLSICHIMTLTLDLDMAPCPHIIAHMDMDMTPCLHICHFKLLSLTSLTQFWIWFYSACY